MDSLSVTAVVAAFRADNLDGVMESIMGQTRPPEAIVMVNDGQPHVREWWQRKTHDTSFPHGIFTFVDLSRRQRRYGLYSRNIGIVLSRTSHVAFHDDDVLWTPDHLESLVSTADEPLKIAYSDMVIRPYGGGEDRVKECALSRQNIDLGCLLWPKWVFDKDGMFVDSEEAAFSYDWALIKKVMDGQWERAFFPTGKPTFIFYHKKK